MNNINSTLSFIWDKFVTTATRIPTTIGALSPTGQSLTVTGVAGVVFAHQKIAQQFPDSASIPKKIAFHATALTLLVAPGIGLGLGAGISLSDTLLLATATAIVAIAVEIFRSALGLFPHTPPSKKEETKIEEPKKEESEIKKEGEPITKSLTIEDYLNRAKFDFEKGDYSGAIKALDHIAGDEKKNLCKEFALSCFDLGLDMIADQFIKIGDLKKEDVYVIAEKKETTSKDEETKEDLIKTTPESKVEEIRADIESEALVEPKKEVESKESLSEEDIKTDKKELKTELSTLKAYFEEEIPEEDLTKWKEGLKLRAKEIELARKEIELHESIKKEKFKEARDYFEKGDFSKAIDALRLVSDALRLVPQRYSSELKKLCEEFALSCCDQSNYTISKEFIELGKLKHEDIFLKVAKERLDKGLINTASDPIEELINDPKILPTLSDYYKTLCSLISKANLAKGDVITAFSAALPLKAFPEENKYLFPQISEAFLSKGMLENALIVAKLFKDSEGDRYKKLCFIISNAYLAKGELDQALIVIEPFKTSEEHYLIDETYKTLCIAICRVYIAKGELTKALAAADLLKGSKTPIDHKNPYKELCIEIGRAYLKKGELDEALKVANLSEVGESSLVRADEYKAFCIEISRAYLVNDELEKSFNALPNCFKYLWKERSKISGELAQKFYEKKNYEMAMKCNSDFVNLNPRTAKALYVQILLEFIKKKEISEVQKVFEAFLDHTWGGMSTRYTMFNRDNAQIVKFTLEKIKKTDLSETDKMKLINEALTYITSSSLDAPPEGYWDH